MRQPLLALAALLSGSGCVPKIDCARLTDHALALTPIPAGVDMTGVRPSMMAACKTVWHADHPSRIAADSNEAVLACFGSTNGWFPPKAAPEAPPSSTPPSAH